MEKPTLSFEEALASVYAEFGMFGFNEFVQRAHFAARAKHQKIWWKYFKQFWQPPQIIATFLLWGVVWMGFERFDYQIVMCTNTVLLLTHAAVSMYRFFRMLH